MFKIRVFFAIALTALLMHSSSAAAQEAGANITGAVASAPAGTDITGSWHVVDSAVRYKISYVAGALHIDGWDSGTGEKIRTSDVQWDESNQTLTGIFVQKKRTSYSSFVLIRPDTFKGAAGEVWKRQPAAVAPAPAGASAQQRPEAKPPKTPEPKPPEAASPEKPGAAAPQAPEAAPTAPAGPDITGQWHVMDSAAVFKISLAGSNIHIEGWDSVSGEKFRISDARWSETTLSFVRSSAQKTVYESLLLVDPDTFKGLGGEVWKRQTATTISSPAVSSAQQEPAAKPAEAPSRAAPSQDITGEWRVADSSSVFKLSSADGKIRVEGWDSASGETFRISDVRWSEKSLSFVLSSTNRIVFKSLVLIDPDTFKGIGGEVWKRQPEAGQPAPAGGSVAQNPDLPATEAPAPQQQKAETPPPAASPPKPAGPDITGQWQVVESTAIFNISFDDGKVRIEGWDTSDGEHFRVSDVTWDGKRLKGTFVMPSTNGTTYSNLLLENPDTLKGWYKGDSTGVEVWKRQQVAVPAPAPAPPAGGAALQQKTDPKPLGAPVDAAAGPDISGAWHAAGSTAVFNISYAEGKIHIEGSDSATGEQLTISDAYWNGKNLSCVITNPATKSAEYPSLILTDPYTLKGAGGEVWKRQLVAAAPVPALTGGPPAPEAATPEPAAPQAAGPDITGEWHVVDSTAVFKITSVAGTVLIEGFDSATGEKFRISDVQWTGKNLSGIFVLPSAKSTVYKKLSLVDPDTFKGANGEVWKRQ